MGAYTRLLTYLNGTIRSRLIGNPLGALRNFVDEFFKSVPGLTFGPAWEFDDINYPGLYRPGGPFYNPVGEKDGELWVSDNISPAQTWIWSNGAWNGLSAAAGSTPATLRFRAKDADDVDDPGLYRETTGGFFPSNITWWQSPAKLVKVKEILITRDINQNPTTLVWRFYEGGALARTYTDVVTYSGVIETSRSRSYV